MVIEKYGFVYLWRDKKHKRFYLGSHWGTKEDVYICGSTWMRNAFSRRPFDFKRRILAIILTNRLDTYFEEQKWLNKIKDEELGKKYYNLKKKSLGTDTGINNPAKRLEIRKKLSENHRKSNSTECKKLISLHHRGKNSEETKKKISEKLKGHRNWNKKGHGKGISRNKGKVPWNKGIKNFKNLNKRETISTVNQLCSVAQMVEPATDNRVIQVQFLAEQPIFK